MTDARDLESPPLVDAAWLRDHLTGTVILDASIERTEDDHGRGRFGPGRAAFLSSRIPGARLADLFGQFSDPDAEFAFTRPPVPHLRAAAQAVGVHDDARVVVYDRNGGAWAARVWWLLRIHGFRRASVLDGGLSAWEAAGSPLETGVPAATEPASRPLTLSEPAPNSVTADLREIESIARGEHPGLLVCGVRQSEFEGDPSAPGSGHIPGSASLPYRELSDARGSIDVHLVRSRATALGLDRADTAPVVYCGGGINAAGLVLALAAAGLPEPRLYDGSLTEWRADPARPLETGPGVGSRGKVAREDESVDG
ncbi:MAG: sulfurtransferase [Microbacterium sp.]|uniref:sulfurtransferase n=1 Tax=Microbacterium sp. TaxID=51671 RepID=UPI0025FFD250|nr:rhodanese-like domain-containing protein [Microbacterium sp.]MBQ9919163.1 sulfurtransferase [Microbacterium sp.]